MWLVKVAHCISLNYLHINTELLNHILWHTSSPLFVLFTQIVEYVVGGSCPWVSVNHLHINTSNMNHILWHTSSPLFVLFTQIVEYVVGGSCPWVSVNHLHINTSNMNHILLHTSSPLFVLLHNSHKEIFQGSLIRYVVGGNIPLGQH